MRIESSDEAQKRRKNLLKEVVGVDIARLMSSEDVTEIMRNEDGFIWYKKFGEDMQRSSFQLSDKKTMIMICMLANHNGIVINEESTSIKGIYPETGDRVQANVPPSTQGPIFSIRKKSSRVYTLEDYVAQGIMTDKCKDIVIEAIRQNKNIIVSGGTNTGKTTFVNALIKELEKYQRRIGVVEDTREIQCNAQNRFFLKTLEDKEKSKSVSMRDLIKDCLRHNVDTIVVGEVRGAEAYDLLSAMNTGHAGIGTVHANTAKLTLMRLNALIKLANFKDPDELIGRYLDIVISLQIENKKLKLVEIIEVDWDFKNHEYLIKNLL